MSSNRLRENLDAVAEAAGGVGRLRELILQLAVQGKLVEQDPKEEPARSLLARLCARLNRWHQVDQTGQGPYSIPTTWIWTDLGNLIEDITSGWSPNCESRTKSDDEWGVLKVSAVSWGVFLPNENKALPLELEPRQQFAVQSGDFLMSRANTAELVGRSVIVDQVPPRLLLSDKLLRVSVPAEISKHYLNLFMASPSARSYLAEKSSGTSASMRNVSREVIKAMLIAVPPLAEQKRIVAKVDELMALCDELEQKQEQRHTVRRAAHTSALDALTNAQTPDELAHAWERLQKHWDVLAAHADAVPPLRQAILQLAVQGRLVKQDSNDDPAESIVAQWSRPSANIAGPFLLPASWQWCRVADAGEVKLGRQRSPENHQGTHMVPYLRVANVQEARIDLSDVKEMNFTPDEQLIYRLSPDDVLLNEGQSYELVGRPAIYRGEVPNACFQNTLLRFRSSPGVVPEFALIVFRSYMRSGRFRKEAQQTTNIAHLSASRLSSIEFPLPPTAEQKRIVARVDELMALCDSLEQRAREQEALASQLAHAAVAAVATG